jgi:Fic family protein
MLKKRGQYFKMQPDDFSAKQRQHLTKTTSGSWAFIPPKLPPQIEYGPIAFNLAAATGAIGELKGATRRLPNPYMLVMPLIRKEALTSSAIEGTITTINNMLLEQIAPREGGDDNAREAFNYVRALRGAEDDLKKLPISHRVIKQAHKTLLSSLSPTRGAGKRPGEYKSDQNAIGKQGDDENTARYVPPPPNETAVCMDELERFINREDRKPGEELIDIALAHYQFEAIHPFNDGNGRIGRMLVTLMAQQLLFSSDPLLHISANIENKKDEYISKLFAVSTQGDWTNWINFFLDAVKESCMSATNVVDKIINLQTDLRQKAIQRNGNHRLATIVDSLFTKEWITIGEAAKLCRVTYPTAQSDLDELATLEIIQRVQNARPIIYISPAIWNLGGRG